MRDEACIIQKWNKYEQGLGILHLRTTKGEKKVVRIAYTANQQQQLNEIFKRLRLFYLKPQLQRGKDPHRYIRGSPAFRSYQDKNFAVRSILMEQVEEWKEKYAKLQNTYKEKYEKLQLQKQKALQLIKQFVQKDKAATSNYLIQRQQNQNLKKQIRRLKGDIIVEQVNFSDILHDYQKGDKYKGLFVGGYYQYRGQDN